VAITILEAADSLRGDSAFCGNKQAHGGGGGVDARIELYLQRAT
jgi:hypothetical protein